MRKIVEAEIMSGEYKKIKITLTSGEVIVGRSMGIHPAFDDEGEELDYDVLHFDAEIPAAYYTLKDEDIVKVEKASEVTQWVDGEYDRPLPDRITNPTQADYDKLQKLLEKYNMMNDENKAAVYETHIEDMLNAIQERLDELSGKDLDDFEKGRQLAFIEMFDIIKTRHQIIWEVLDE